VRRLSILAWAAALAGVLAAAAPAAAIVCAADAVPGATLLLPYFEVDLDDPNGLTTLFSVNNASATAVIAHAVVWSDLAVPVLGFDIYLTGYDVQTLNLRDVFNGNLPSTGPSISPNGPLSQAGPGFPGCSGSSAAATRGAGPEIQSSLRAAHTGQPIPNTQPAQCAASAHPKSPLVVGYITVDVVNRCSGTSMMSTANTPADPAYFAKGGTGLASDVNVLWGDVFFHDPQLNQAMSQPAITVLADANFFNPGDYTFYGRYDNFDSRDDRMPLSSMYYVRFVNSGPLASGTDLLVWRDNRSAEASALPCGSVPSWAAPGEEQLLIFDEQENAAALSKPNAFPFATQRVKVGGRTIPTRPSSGWLMLDLWHADGTHAQGWVGSLLATAGRFTSGHDAMRADDLCNFGP